MDIHMIMLDNTKVGVEQTSEEKVDTAVADLRLNYCGDEHHAANQPTSSDDNESPFSFKLSPLIQRRGASTSQMDYLFPPVNVSPMSSRFSSVSNLASLDTNYQIDIKSGPLMYVHHYRKQDYTSNVFVKVFGNSYEHHAQIYTDSGFSNLLGYISLRNCDISMDKIAHNLMGIFIKDKSHDFKFIAQTEADALDWVEAFIPKIPLPKTSNLSPNVTPTLGRHIPVDSSHSKKCVFSSRKYDSADKMLA